MKMKPLILVELFKFFKLENMMMKTTKKCLLRKRFMNWKWNEDEITNVGRII